MGTRWRALVLLCVAQFMVILDITVVNVALPSIGADLDLGRSALTWVVTAYTLCFGGLMLLGGRLADRFGRRRMFLAGLLLFTGASLAAGLSTGATWLVAARAAQGVGAALLSPAALAVLTVTYSGAARQRALGVWAAIGGSGAAVGVLAGGLLVSGPGWEWAFFLNVPVGLAVAALAPSVLSAGRASRSARVDVPGAVLVTGATAALIYGLVRAGDLGWASAGVLVPLAGAVLGYALFVLVERRSTDPLVALRLLAARPMAAGTGVMLAASALLISGFFLTSLLLQTVYGRSALATGLLFLPVAVATVAGAHTAGRLVGQVGARPVAAGGFGLAAAGLALLAAGTRPAWVVTGFALAAAGIGAGFVVATTTALTRVDPHHAGMASGTVNTAHELGGALGVALVSTIAGAAIHTGTPTTAGGFATAYWACAALAAAVALASPALLPAGRPPVTDGPVFAH